MDSHTDLSSWGFASVRRLGKGHSTCTDVVEDLRVGEVCVAKSVLLAALTEHHQELAKQEVVLLRSLRHPNIVAYRDSFFVDGTSVLVIVMEYCEGGDLRNLIVRAAQAAEHFAEEQVCAWLVQIASALRYIHSKKVLHRDLKTSNIFVSQGTSVLKLGDFGISRVLEATADAASTLLGTPYYMSPEVCCNEPYSWKSDVWSFGCVVYELCKFKHPFESKKLHELVHMITNGLFEAIPSFYSDELASLLSRMLAKSAAERPSVDEILAEPYVRQGAESLQDEAVTPPGTPPENLFEEAPRQSFGTPPGTPPEDPNRLEDLLRAAERCRRGEELLLD